MNKFDDIFSRLKQTFNTKERLNNGVNISEDIYTITIHDSTIMIGSGTLRFIYSDNEKNVSIAISPVVVSLGSYKRDIELTINVFDSDFKNTYNRLHVDGGELFQYTTVHDFDFGIVPEIMNKYLELLKVMKVSPRLNPQEYIDQAIDNITAAVEAYELEAK